MVVYRAEGMALVFFLGDHGASQPSNCVQQWPDLLPACNRIESFLAANFLALLYVVNGNRHGRIERQERIAMPMCVDNGGPRNKNVRLFFLYHDQVNFSMKIGFRTNRRKIIQVFSENYILCRLFCLLKCAINILPTCIITAVDHGFVQFARDGEDVINSILPVKVTHNCTLFETSFRIALDEIGTWWVLGRRFGSRTLYILLDSKLGLLQAQAVAQRVVAFFLHDVLV